MAAGDIVEIPNLSGKWVEVNAHYDYGADKTKCPICGGLGTPWLGWYSCESQNHKSVVEDGRTFVRMS